MATDFQVSAALPVAALVLMIIQRGGAAPLFGVIAETFFLTATQTMRASVFGSWTNALVTRRPISFVSVTEGLTSKPGFNQDQQSVKPVA